VALRKSEYLALPHLAQTSLAVTESPIAEPACRPRISNTVPTSAQTSTITPHVGQVENTNSPCPSQQVHRSLRSSQDGVSVCTVEWANVARGRKPTGRAIRPTHAPLVPPSACLPLYASEQGRQPRNHPASTHPTGNRYQLNGEGQLSVGSAGKAKRRDAPDRFHLPHAPFVALRERVAILKLVRGGGVFQPVGQRYKSRRNV
jgi:hypothetical protein